jgi:hypothetical protein
MSIPPTPSAKLTGVRTPDRRAPNNRFVVEERAVERFVSMVESAPRPMRYFLDEADALSNSRR